MNAPQALLLMLLSLGQPPQTPRTDTIPAKLRVATRHVPPFAIKDDQGEWSGISIDLLRQITTRLRGGQPAELEFQEMGLKEMQSAVAAGRVDVAAAALTVNLDREQRMDFLHPFHTSGLGIAVAKNRHRGWLSAVQRVFSTAVLKLLAGLVTLLLFSGALIYAVERRGNPEQFGGSFWSGLGAGVWWSIVTLTTVGYGDKAPRTFVGRALAVVWMLSGLLIISGFTAAITSALTVGQLTTLVGGPADLRRVRVATVADSTSAAYLLARRVSFRQVADIDEALPLLASGQIDAIVYDAPILRYQVARQFSAELIVLPSTFERQDYAFALPDGSPLREQLNREVLRALGDASWETTLSKYLGAE